MKEIALICLFVITATHSKIFNYELNQHWENFKIKFSKRYQRNEEIGRRFIWEQNVNYIIKHNLEYDLGLHSYTLGLNEYSDLTKEEFEQGMKGMKRKLNNDIRPTYNFMNFSNVILPDTVDWREEGLVTDVKNQEHCGSCWAFSTTGSLEGQHKKKTGKLVSLSEQNLVDCSKKDNLGCAGGMIDSAFEYIIHNGGIDTESSYPYEAKDDKCRFKRENVGATCVGFVDIPSGDETKLKEAVAIIGPISVSIDATKNFELYRGGILDDQECSSKLYNHAVLAVGYGTENGKDYWLIKNSWGTSWGMKGYIKMSRNKQNQCAIATQASYPLI
uniref:Cathepsin L-like cysteine peptidase 4 protein n=1 Tax=Tityus serrulatus TaxID=6887 RepID=U6JRM3_TITSE|nr:cathepsin L-like cysteine peptidase 4 protein [Tityus serrulatus]